MRMKMLITALFLAVCFSSESFALAIAGITMPENLKAGDNQLVLNGAGIRTKFGLNIYAGGLFLNSKTSDSAAIIKADEPMIIRLHIVSKLISSKDFEEATREGFNRSTEGNIAPIKNQIEEFIAVFKEGISKNDIYDITYVPGKGVTVYKNGAQKATSTGLAFKKALFGIWLCPRAMNPKLRAGMLGSK